MSAQRARKRRALVWSERAIADLEEIALYIARDDASAAERWIERIGNAARRASALPMAGRRVPELARDDIREVFSRTYRIVYRVTRARIEVLTVFEGHRSFPRRFDR